MKGDVVERLAIGERLRGELGCRLGAKGGIGTRLVGWYVEKGRGLNGWAVDAFRIFGVKDCTVRCGERGRSVSERCIVDVEGIVCH